MHETKDNFLEICLTASTPSFIMSYYREKEKAKVVQFYLESKSIILTQRRFKVHFKTKSAPSRNTILSLTEKFLRVGSVKNLQKSFSGRKKWIRTAERVQSVRTLVNNDPRKSHRRLAQEAGCSSSTTQRILRKDLQMFPYKLSMRSKLTEADRIARSAFCECFLRKCREIVGFLENVWFTDEAHFYLDGRINTQNNRIWSDRTPDVVAECQLHPPRCTAWCAVGSSGIIGPIWIEDDAGEVLTVTAERYRQVLQKFWAALQRKCVDTINEQWLQQDGAPAHAATATIRWLQERFGERVIARGTSFTWPPRSPDLTPPDFYLWGRVKEVAYKREPRTIPELKAAVTACVRAVTTEECRRVLEEVRRRAEICLARNGGHFEHLL